MISSCLPNEFNIRLQSVKKRNLQVLNHKSCQYRLVMKKLKKPHSIFSKQLGFSLLLRTKTTKNALVRRSFSRYVIF